MLGISSFCFRENLFKAVHERIPLMEMRLYFCTCSCVTQCYIFASSKLNVYFEVVF